MPFIALGLIPPLVQAASKVGYAEPTPVQSETLPAILAGRDVLASARTGSGKTAAYLLPLLQKMLALRHDGRRELSALILVPTRELAAQVGDTLSGLVQALPKAPEKAAASPLKIAVAFGGVSINPQLMGLRGGADVMIATPGRLLDLIAHNALRLNSLSILVLDEADRLLDLGFSDELHRILDQLPVRRQTLMFSATFAPDIEVLAGRSLSDPIRIAVAPESENSSVPDIAQRAIEVDANRRTQLLARLVKDEKWERVLVFVATKFAAEIVADKLRKAGLDAEPFHGVLSQGKRSQVLADLKASRVQVVVATDLAARGIDVVQLPVVVNYDLPRSATDHIHRIGRTGRAGETGVAVSFVTEESEAHFRLIEKRQGFAVARERIAGFEPAPRAPAAEPVDHAEVPGTGGVKGKRPSKKDKLRASAALSADGGAETDGKKPA